MLIELWIALLLAQAGLEAPSRPIELSGVVEKSTYCEGTDEFSILQLSLQLKYQNVSNGPVIVSREMLFLDVSIGRNEVNGTANDLEVRFSRSIYTEGPVPINDSWPNPAFVLLKSGETFVSQDMVAVPIALKPGVPAAAGVGQHFLQSRAVMISPFSSESVDHLRQAWSQIGLLWTTPILTKPIPFTVESMPRFEICE